MPVDAKTIQIFLPDGQPRGLRVAEITTRIVVAVQAPRARLTQLLARPETRHVGLYFLFGDPDASGKPLVYIGQTEDFDARLKNHHADREFWTTAIVLVSRTQSFTQAHIRYLEWLSIKTAADVGRYRLENGNAGSKPYLPEAMEADVLDAFETAGVLLATLGFPIFESATAIKQPNAKQVFHCRGPHADARGTLVDDGFVIFKGGLTRRKPAPSATASFGPWIEELITSGVLDPVNEDECRLTQDYVATSPSYAAALVLARHANGWVEWVRDDGQSLHDVYRTNASTEPTSA